MQTKPSKMPFTVTLEFPSGATRKVKVKAISLEIAEHRALKFHPGAKGVKRDAT